MKRAFLGWCLCALALSSGLLTAGYSAANRARGDELDRLERWCEAQSRRNELARLANQRQEWLLLCGEGQSMGLGQDGREKPRAKGGVAP